MDEDNGKKVAGFAALPTAAKVGIVTAAAVAVVGASAGVGAYVSTQTQANVDTEETSTSIGYASEGVMVLDDDSDTPAIDPTKSRGVGVMFQNDAYSTDGQTFNCYIGNPERNERDMFIAIYSDNTLSEELFVSQLLQPGTGFNTITLNRALEEGDHRLVVALTLVEGEEEALYAQSMITMDFHVDLEDA